MTDTNGQLTAKLDEHAEPPRLLVSGDIDIDIDNADEFEKIVRESVERVHPLVVDLTEVRFLGSVGIHVLLANQARLHSVHARAETIVARALTLVQYPKLTIGPAA